GLFCRSGEDLIVLHDWRRLRRSGRQSGPPRPLGSTRGRLGDARGLGDTEGLDGGGAPHLLGRKPGLLGAARLFLAALLVATLLFLPPLGRAPLLLLAPSRGSLFLVLTPLLLETHRVRDAGFVGGSARFLGRTRRGRGVLHLLSRALRVGAAVGPRRAGGPLRLLRDASRFCGALRLRGALRLESATRFLLGRARLVLCNARLLLRGLRLRRRGVGLAGRVRDRSRLTTDVLEELGEDTAQRVGRERARLGGGLLGRLLRRGSRFAAWSAERGKAAPPVRRDLVDEAVALFTAPLDL